MSISSCPRCAKQVTLPVGVENHAKVRCPLCHERYTLADALLNMPPMLEVIDEEAENPADDWFDLEAHPQDKSEAPHEVRLHDESVADADAERIDLSLRESEHDDLAMQEKDTEVEEIGFSIDDLESAAGAEPIQPAGVAESDDASVLDFDDLPAVTPQVSESAEPEGLLDFGASAPAAVPVESADEPLDLDFGEPTAEQPMGEELHDFSEPKTTQPISEDTLDFGEPQFDTPEAEAESLPDFGGPEFADTGSQEDLDFNELEPAEFAQSAPAEMSAGEEEVGLDFGEPLDASAEPAAEIEAAEIPLDPKAAKKAAKERAKQEKQEKKEQAKQAKKEKQPREPKPAKAGGKRSLLATLVSVAIALLIAVPLTVYALLWLGPDADYFGVAKRLPKAILPASFNKAKAPVFVAQTPPVTPPQMPVETPAVTQTPPADQPAADNAAPSAEAPPAVSAPAATAPTNPESAPTTPVEVPSTASPPSAEGPPQPSAAPAEPAVEPAAESPAKPEPAAAATDAPESGDDDLEKMLKETPGAVTPTPDTVAADETAPEGDKPQEMPAEDAGDDPLATAIDDAAKSEEEMPDDETAAAGTTEVTGPRDAPTFTADDVNKALQGATLADQRLTGAQETKNDSEIKKARKDYYLNWYALADAVTFAKDDPADPRLDAQREEIGALIKATASDKKRLEAIAYNGPRWLAFTKRTTSGVMLAGTVQTVEHLGPLYCIELKMGNNVDAPVITVVTNHDPKLAPNDEAVTLGSIVEHPDEQLTDYQGGDATVVWSGMTLKVVTQ